MDKRDEAVRHVEKSLRNFVTQDPSIIKWHPDIAVKSGGRKYRYAPVPWVRLYSEKHSPSAGKGFYLVYLFAADGSAVYLSINQGTSQPGTTRPVSGGDNLKAKAAEARHAIRQWRISPALSKAEISIDLHGSKRGVLSAYSRKRIRNYEDVNVLAIRYDATNMPSDDVLHQDLKQMLPLLWMLYGEVTPETVSPSNASIAPLAVKTTDRLGTQGRQMNSIKRKAIEVHAEDIAESWLRNQGWHVKRIGAYRLGYDLLCTRGRQELHVEVKGTQTRGEEVILTRGEVEHVRGGRCEEKHALIVCSNIEIQLVEGAPKCSGGTILVLEPWDIVDEKLTPQEYSYLVPHDQGIRIWD